LVHNLYFTTKNESCGIFLPLTLAFFVFQHSFLLSLSLFPFLSYFFSPSTVLQQPHQSKKLIITQKGKGAKSRFCAFVVLIKNQKNNKVTSNRKARTMPSMVIKIL